MTHSLRLPAKGDGLTNRHGRQVVGQGATAEGEKPPVPQVGKKR